MFATSYAPRTSAPLETATVLKREAQIFEFSAVLGSLTI
jgi:hypothetical protein